MVTVFTPTYNRANRLPVLYSSLCNQTSKEFVWVVVDDGSTDNTKDWIRRIEIEAPFEIEYYSQNNQGKHIAYNVGIEKARGDFFICVDSDDILDSDAIRLINSIVNEEYQEIGFIFPSLTFGEEAARIWHDLDGKAVDIIDLHEIYNIIETCIVINTNVLKKYRFPHFYGIDGSEEKFCPEGVLYNQLISEGKFKIVNKAIYFYQYQETGLTNNVFKLWKKNFNSVSAELRSRYIAAEKYKNLQKLKTRIKCVMNYNALCIECGRRLYGTPSLFYSSVLFLPSIVFGKMRYKDV